MEKNHELARKIYNRKMIKKVNKKIKLLGLSTKLDPINFLNLLKFFHQKSSIIDYSISVCKNICSYTDT